MNTKEMDLFFALCDPVSANEAVLDELLPDFASPELLGHLFFNRMQGAAYGNIRDCGMLNRLNREFRRSIQDAYIQNMERNRSYYKCLGILSEILADQKNKYAMLKGALLCGIWPEGRRTSNDVDLLVCPKDVSDIGEALFNAGFRQGSLQNGEFVPAQRREIIESKMMRGETVPYFLKVGLPYMEYLEVDVNFSLDYKNGSADILKQMLSRAEAVHVNGVEISTLDRFDFFIHLCCHLYKEAAVVPWIRMKRDMTLYKYCDIRMLADMMDKEECGKLFLKARELDAEKICGCAVIWTDGLLEQGNQYLTDAAVLSLSGDDDLLHRVVSPSDGKIFLYSEKNMRKRFFDKNRINLLKETEK